MTVYEAFTERFGLFGAGLLTEEEKQDSKGGTKMHFASELPEYADIEAQYLDEEEKLRQYREECKDKAFTLFLPRIVSTKNQIHILQMVQA